ncbi:AMP-binding protein [Streptomyces paludis]|uniref:4-coumarate--CoA ligase family protein n=1 Tax=Streptomyces paludis TaxID=2282738 RepID=A0A345HS39_9ACTN|nr:AMP-binding protein [Streptomyces paludis]AXG79513.1 4-coumarate--CoA ligase family protein [Streptomyces paludis]
MVFHSEFPSEFRSEFSSEFHSETVFRSEYADVPVLDLPIHEAVLGRAAAYGDSVALIDGTNGTTTTYAQLDTAHRRLAAALVDAGVRKGDVLALHSPNSVAYPMVFYAATRAGAAVTTIHPLVTAEELAARLRNSAARWIVTVAPLLEVARRSAELVGGIEEIFVCDRVTGHRSVLDLARGPLRRPLREPSLTPDSSEAATAPDVVISPGEDIAALPYSAGTTGTPKGVILTHRSLATNLAQLAPFLPVRPGDRVLAVLPFFHIYGLTALLNAPLRHGATVVVLPRFDLDQFLRAIEKYRVSGLYVAPSIVLALARHPSVTQHDLSSVEYVLSAAAPLDARLAAACAARLGLPAVRQTYGLTELATGTHVVPPSAVEPPPGTVGKLLPGTEMRIVPLAGMGEGDRTGAEGEILLRGPQVMKGYLGGPEATAATAAVIDSDGWVHTGDIGRADEDGWLHVVDRVAELITHRGRRIAPAELEALLISHDAIADAAVIGVRANGGEREGEAADEAGEDQGEVPMAYIVRQPGTEALTGEQVMTFVAEHVAPYKKVRRVEFIGSVPRAASGKILRRELRDREARDRARGARTGSTGGSLWGSPGNTWEYGREIGWEAR